MVSMREKISNAYTTSLYVHVSKHIYAHVHAPILRALICIVEDNVWMINNIYTCMHVFDCRDLVWFSHRHARCLFIWFCLLCTVWHYIQTGPIITGKWPTWSAQLQTLPIYVGQISLTKIYLSFSCTFMTRPVWILIINAKLLCIYIYDESYRHIFSILMNRHFKIPICIYYMYMCTGLYLYTGLQKCMTGSLVRDMLCNFYFPIFGGGGGLKWLIVGPSPKNPEE